MVNFVDVLVKWAPVKGSVRPVMPSILQYEEDCNLVRNLVPRGERHTCTEAKVQRHGMEEPGLCKTRGDTYKKRGYCPVAQMGKLTIFEEARL